MRVSFRARASEPACFSLAPFLLTRAPLNLSIALYSKVNSIERARLNEPAKQAAESSPGWSERSERNPGYAMKTSYQARFSGRQKLTAALLPAEAGSGFFLAAAPRAALRSTSFRYARPGLNSAGYAGWLNDPNLKSIWLSAIVVILVFFSGCGRLEPTDGSPAPPGSSPEPVSSSLDVVKIKADRVVIATGSNADATVLLAISPGFHVNANPATFPYLIATELDVGNGYGRITAGKPVYPVAQKKRFKFAEQPLAVYESEVKIVLPLRATLEATKGLVSLPISVTVQACDEEKCYPPGSLNTMIPVQVK